MYFLSYDLGTGGLKASLFDTEGKSVASAFVSIDTFYPQENFREQRPDDWWNAVVQSTSALFEQCSCDRNEVIAIAVSGHSLVAAPIDRNGKLLTEYTPIWSDARATKQASVFFQKVDPEKWYLTTGNGFPAHLYSIFEIMWLKDHFPEVYEQTATFIGSKDYINLRLTGEVCTDHSYASGSGVYDLINRCYIPEYIAASEVDPNKLPVIRESAEIIGRLTESAAAQLGLPRSVPVACGGVDNACMCLGAGCIYDGESYTSLGTSAWITVSSHTPIVNAEKRPYVFAHCIPGMFASATSIFSAGNSFRWVRDQLFPDYIEAARKEGKNVYDMLTALAEQSPAGSNKLIFNPTLAGGSGLDRSENIRGCFTGLTLAHTRADLVRATLEGVCMGLRLALDALEETVPLTDEMLIVGGGGKSRFWRSLFADIYDKTIIETNVGEDAGSLGAAIVAATACKQWSWDKVKEIHQRRNVIAPDPERTALYHRMLPIFARVADMQCDIGDMLQEL